MLLAASNSAWSAASRAFCFGGFSETVETDCWVQPVEKSTNRHRTKSVCPVFDVTLVFLVILILFVIVFSIGVLSYGG